MIKIISKYIFYLFFIILPWKEALPNLIGEASGQYIDKVLVLVLTFLTVSNWWPHIRRIKIPMLFLFTFIIFIIIRITFDYNKGSINTQLSEYIIPPLMVLVSLGIFKSKYELNSFLKFFMIYSSLIAVLCLFELFNDSFRDWANELASRKIKTTSLDDIAMRFRARFFFSSPMGYGIHNVFGIIFLIKFLKIERSSGTTLLRIVGILLFLGLLLSFSRGPWIVLIISLLTYIILNFRENRTLFLKIIFFLIVGFFITLSIFPELADLILDRSSSIFDWKQNNSNLERMQRWKYSFNLFLNNFWTGIGISTTGATGLGIVSIITENYFLKLALEGGIILISLFYLLQASIIFSLVKLKNTFKENTLYLSLFLGMFIYMFIFQILDSRIIAYEYWTIFGISINDSIKSRFKN